jgi:hypothetical protein
MIPLTPGPGKNNEPLYRLKFLSHKKYLSENEYWIESDDGASVGEPFGERDIESRHASNMLAAAIVTVLGLLAGIVAAQLRGLRLGGVVVVPLLAVYCLRSFATFVVIVTSVVGAYTALSIIKRRHFVYGRRLFVFAVLIGAAVPVVIVESVALWSGQRLALTEADFLGSILPGIAAYNFHRLDIERRVEDALWSLATLLFLVVVGVGLVVVLWLSPFRETLPTVLLGAESDVAASLGIALEASSRDQLGSVVTILALVSAGMLVSELARKRYALRIGGVIVVPLLALFALRNGALLALAGAAGIVAYVAIQLLHRWSLLYGRVLLSMSQIVSLLTTIVVVPFLDTATGLLPFFTAVLAGVAAYHLHVTPPAERRATVLVTLATLCGFLWLSRALLTPAPAGVLRAPGPLHAAISVVLLAAGGSELYALERIRPGGSRRWPLLVDDVVTRASDGD